MNIDIAKMPVVILAGGRGTRLYGENALIPKPMTMIGQEPIILHIMRIYGNSGFKNFILAGGFRWQWMREWFEDCRELPHDWKVTVLDTGYNAMTGGRILALKSKIGHQPFMCTYGDGLANIDFDKLLKEHFMMKNYPVATITAVHPPARWGDLKIDKTTNMITKFSEKPIQSSWINGGFFVLNPEIFDYIENDHTYFESETIPRLVQDGAIKAHLHSDWWQCMDTPRDVQLLQELWLEGKAPWKVWADER